MQHLNCAHQAEPPNSPLGGVHTLGGDRTHPWEVFTPLGRDRTPMCLHLGRTTHWLQVLSHSLTHALSVTLRTCFKEQQVLPKCLCNIRFSLKRARAIPLCRPRLPNNKREVQKTHDSFHHGSTELSGLDLDTLSFRSVAIF